MNGHKIFGILLVILGIFIGACVIISDNSLTSIDLKTAYQHGILVGTAISMCSIGGLLSSGKLDARERNDNQIEQ